MLGEYLALLAALSWATVGVAVGLLVRGIHPFVIIATRLLLGTLVLSPALLVIGLRGSLGPWPLWPMALLVGSGMISLGIGDGLYAASLPYIGVSRAHPISITLFPLLTFILAVTLLSEVITTATILGALLIIAGIMMVVLSGRAFRDGHGPAAGGRRGMVLVVVAAVLWAAGFGMLKLGVADVNPLTAGYVRLVAGGLLLLVILRARNTRLGLRQWTGRQWAGLVWIGLMTALSAGFLVVIAVKHAGAARVSVLISTSPLFALPLAFVFLRERITWRTVLGTLVAIGGTWLVIRT